MGTCIHTDLASGKFRSTMLKMMVEFKNIQAVLVLNNGRLYKFETRSRGQALEIKNC